MTKPEKITILIAEDHSLIRESLGVVLQSNPGYKVVAACGRAEDVIEMTRILNPMVILMDINLPGTNGIEATKIIHASNPGVKILGMSMHSQPAYALSMIKSGAAGYLTKDVTVEEMFEAIDYIISSGRTYICREIKDKISSSYMLGDSPDKALDSLTVRETDIVSLIRKGHSSKQIAARFGLSHKTIEVHRHNIFKKLNINNAVSLVNLFNNHPVSISH